MSCWKKCVTVEAGSCFQAINHFHNSLESLHTQSVIQPKIDSLDIAFHVLGCTILNKDETMTPTTHNSNRFFFVLYLDIDFQL
ncbi:hypothetical protein STEG23_015748, partial [Scotinomys teguina]